MNTARIATVTVPLSFMLAAVSFATNPYIGTWKFNEAKSKLRPGVTENSTVTYSEQGDKIKAIAEGMDKDGKPIHSVWIGKFDGRPYPVKGNPFHDAESYRPINDYTRVNVPVVMSSPLSARPTIAPRKSRTTTAETVSLYRLH
jgi:hypothetical protein